MKFNRYFIFHFLNFLSILFLTLTQSSTKSLRIFTARSFLEFPLFIVKSSSSLSLFLCLLLSVKLSHGIKNFPLPFHVDQIPETSNPMILVKY